MSDDRLRELVELSRTLGEPERDLAILAEGNVSMHSGADRMIVKATGSTMPTATTADFVEVNTATLTAVVSDSAAGDRDVAAAMHDCRVSPDAPLPSMEALLHAVIQRHTDIDVVAHTHPTAVNAVLCSDRAGALVAGALFPDQVVVLGRHNLLIPYADPGLALARAVRDRLSDHIAVHGGPPKVIYLANHGMFALGASTAEVLAITSMAVKTARVLAGALACGQVRYLPEEQAERIDVRPDEQFRRQRLAQAGAS